MFLAPFGMLISKWAAIQAFIDAPLGFIFVIILAFGSAMTVFFWAKWMGKILTVTTDNQRIESEVDKSEWAALLSLAGLSVVTTLVFPLLSTKLLEPFIYQNYGVVASITQDNIIIMILMLFMILLLPLSILLPHRKHRHLAPYMGGRTTTQDLRFAGSLGIQKKTILSNYYLHPYFGEAKLKPAGIWLCSALIAIMLLATALKGVIL
jgi:ech hydrogenase subunit A